MSWHDTLGSRYLVRLHLIVFHAVVFFHVIVLHAVVFLHRVLFGFLGLLVVLLHGVVLHRVIFFHRVLLRAVLFHGSLLHGILREGGERGHQDTRDRETAENVFHSFLP